MPEKLEKARQNLLRDRKYLEVDKRDMNKKAIKPGEKALKKAEAHYAKEHKRVYGKESIHKKGYNKESAR